MAKPAPPATLLPTAPPSIQVLPQSVIDRIKAGEVVQRASSAIKELIENSLDAGATEITVSVSTDCRTQLTVSDNGSGMVDLSRAVQRHATSKLRHEQDLSTIQTLGFRGEALASIVQASRRVVLTSKTRTGRLAFKQRFSATAAATKPTPTARPGSGTTVTIHDLFYNAPVRQKHLSNEYANILQVVQHCALQHSNVAFTCRREKKKKQGSAQEQVDIHTGPMVSEHKGDRLPAIIAHLYGNHLLPHLRMFRCESNPPQPKNGAVSAFVQAARGGGRQPSQPDENAPKPSFLVHGYATVPTYNNNKTSVILSINNRWVDCPVLLKRSLEDLWRPHKPWLCLFVTVPPTHVDVNIHPAKRQVALLFLEELAQAIVQTLLKEIIETVTDRSFAMATPLNTKKESSTTTTQPANTQKETVHPQKSSQQKKLSVSSSSTPSTAPSTKRSRVDSSSRTTPKSTQTTLSTKRIRTDRAAPQGAIEPFLVTPTVATTNNNNRSSNKNHQHSPDCPLSRRSTDEIDMTQPGAFAVLASRCRCRRFTTPTKTVRHPTPVLRRIRPVPIRPCSYQSIQQLRRRALVVKDTLPEQEEFRRQQQLTLVGVVSAHRSLVQRNDQLVLWNHAAYAQELFYQLALRRFGGGSTVARVPVPLDVAALIAEGCFVDDEEQATETASSTDAKGDGDGSSSSNNDEREADLTAASQAADCLWTKAEMLHEYFGIEFKQDGETVLLKGLPVLLDGHEPLPSALPLFLLRLATEVNWSDEKACFRGICRELACYYAQLPSLKKDLESTVRHCLFPAVNALLVPSKKLDKDGGMTALTNLDTLYRTFERC